MIHWLVVRQALGPLVAGLLIGAAAAIGVQRVIGGLLFGVQVGDPSTTAGVITLITGITLAACYGPARRATRIDPVQALAVTEKNWGGGGGGGRREGGSRARSRRRTAGS